MAYAIVVVTFAEPAMPNDATTADLFPGFC